jgi:hypothetical protein
MRKRDRKVLDRYVTALVEAMGLRDWHICLSPVTAEDGSDAEIVVTFGRKEARVLISDSFREQDADHQRNTLVHELLHCHLEPMSSMVERDLEDVLGKAADAVFSAGFERHLEYCVDGIAAILAPHMPLIEWPS